MGFPGVKFSYITCCGVIAITLLIAGRSPPCLNKICFGGWRCVHVACCFVFVLINRLTRTFNGTMPNACRSMTRVGFVCLLGNGRHGWRCHGWRCYFLHDSWPFMNFMKWKIILVLDEFLRPFISRSSFNLFHLHSLAPSWWYWKVDDERYAADVSRNGPTKETWTLWTTSRCFCSALCQCGHDIFLGWWSAQVVSDAFFGKRSKHFETFWVIFFESFHPLDPTLIRRCRDLFVISIYMSYAQII